MPAEPVPTSAPTLRSVLRGRRGAFLGALLLAEFAAAMQGIAYSTVLPVIAADLDGFTLFGATLAAGSVAAVLLLSYAPAIFRLIRPQRVLLAATLLYVGGVATAVLAPSMVCVLVGAIIRGIAAGLFGGFGMSAIGSLFDERERPRVFGLFALIWLLPSVVGPPLNALIAETSSWRWAVGWPAVLVVIARVLMGATISAVPWERGAGNKASAGVGVAVAGSLALAAWGSTTSGVLGQVALEAGIVCGGASIAVHLTRGLPASRSTILAFALLCATYFGATELLSLSLVQGLGASVLVASIAVTGGLVAWSLVGLRPRSGTRPDLATLGPGVLVVGIVAVLGGLAIGGAVGTVGIVLVIVGAVLAGAGMGAAYPLLSSEPFTTGAPPTTVGSMIAFAETASTAWSALVAGGTYSALHGDGWRPVPALLVGYGVLAVLGALTVVVSARRHRAAIGAAVS